MKIIYKNRKIKKICTIACETERKYGLEIANKIHQHIDEIHASDTVEEIIQFYIERCHQLKRKRNGYFAMDLVHQYRLIFEKIRDIMATTKNRNFIATPPGATNL